MKRLHVFILKSFAGPFVLTFFITTFILLMQFLWRYIEDLVGKGLEFSVILQLMTYISATLIPMALPLAILLASLMTFGNLGENHELVALKSSGISLQKIMRPLFILIFIVSIGAFYFSNNIVPSANLKMTSLLNDIKKQKPEFQIKEGVFYNGIEGYSLKVGRKNPETHKLFDIMIYDHTAEEGNTKITIADSGFMKMTQNEDQLLITLYNGHTYTELRKKNRNDQHYFPHRKDKFKEQQIILDLTGFGLNRSDKSIFRSHYKMMNIGQLASMEDSLAQKVQKKQQRYIRSMTHSRYFVKPKIRKTLDSLTVPNKTPDSIPSPLYQSSQFDSLTFNQQKQIVRRALNSARNVKNFTEAKKQTLKHHKQNLYMYRVEWHRKFTLSLACLIFFFIGAPLGAIIRKGGFGTPIVISVVVFILYYVITMFGENLVEDLVISPLQGMWVPTFLILPFGIFLTYKATTDSAILHTETYQHMFQKIKKILLLFRFTRQHKLTKGKK